MARRLAACALLIPLLLAGTAARGAEQLPDPAPTVSGLPVTEGPSTALDAPPPPAVPATPPAAEPAPPPAGKWSLRPRPDRLPAAGASPAATSEAKGYQGDPRSGFRLGLYAGRVLVGGALRDDRLLADPWRVILVPKVLDGQGLAIALGGALARGVTHELRLQTSLHDATVAGRRTTARLGNYTYGVRGCGFDDRLVRPCFQFGFGFSYLKVYNAAADDQGAIGSAGFTAYVAEAGLGLEVRLASRLSLVMLSLYDLTLYSSAKALGSGNKDIGEKGIRGDALNLNVGLAYLF